jgi:maleate cis-trans isomerase
MPRIGVLVPAGNPTVEPELSRMAPPAVTLHFARLTSAEGTPGAADGMEGRLLGYLQSLPAVLPALAAVEPSVVVLAHTAVSYATGFAEEPALVARMAEVAGCPAITAARAILAALSHLGVRRIALAVPYPAAIEALGATYWTAAGLEVVARRRLDNVANIYEETEARARALGRDADTAEAEAVLISGTGLPTAGIVEPLEHELEKPVITAQTAALWHALRVAGVAAPVKGYGRLLSA